MLYVTICVSFNFVAAAWFSFIFVRFFLLFLGFIKRTKQDKCKVYLSFIILLNRVCKFLLSFAFKMKPFFALTPRSVFYFENVFLFLLHVNKFFIFCFCFFISLLYSSIAMYVCILIFLQVRWASQPSLLVAHSFRIFVFLFTIFRSLFVLNFFLLLFFFFFFGRKDKEIL